MATLLAPAPRVIRSFRREMPPVHPTRISEKPTAPFGEGLIAEKPSEPTVFGVGLSNAEFTRLTKAQNDARFRYGMDNLEATDSEIEAVAWAAREAEFKQIMDERAEAAKVAAEPARKPTSRWIEVEMVSLESEPLSVRKPVGRPVNRPFRPLTSCRKPYTAADVAWEMENSPLNQTCFDVEIAPISGGSPESVREFSESWNLPSDDEDDDLSFSERLELLPETEPELSDDANGAFGTGGVE